MATDKLSDVALRSIKPRDKQFKLSDGGGLFLLVNPNGSHLWRLGDVVDDQEIQIAVRYLGTDGVKPGLVFRNRKGAFDHEERIL